MTAITSVTGQQQLFRPVENKPEMSSEDTKTARISHELMMLKTVHGGFISSDKKMQLLELGVSQTQLESIENNRFRLLDGMQAAMGIGFIATPVLESVIDRIDRGANNQKQSWRN